MSQMPSAPLYYVDSTRPYFGETAGDLVAKGWSVLPADAKIGSLASSTAIASGRSTAAT